MRRYQVLYVHLARLPGDGASSIQVARMSEGLADAGCVVTLVALGESRPTRRSVSPTSVFEHYGIQESIRIVFIPCPPLETQPRWVRGFTLLVLAFACSIYATLRRDDIVYTRDPLVAVLSRLFGRTTVFEKHAPPQSRFALLLHRIIRRSKRRLVSVYISEALRRVFAECGLLGKGPAVVAHDAVASRQVSAYAANSRRTPSQPIAMYVGSFLPGRGVDLILEVALMLPHIEFRLVGGYESHLEDSKGVDLPLNVSLLGRVKPAQVPTILRQADIVLMPYQFNTQTRGGLESAEWMSPLKLFEYMASGAAIIASDLPVLHEVLEHRRNSLLVPASDTHAWRVAIDELATDASLRERLSSSAATDVLESHTWEIRAQRVLSVVASYE